MIKIKNACRFIIIGTSVICLSLLISGCSFQSENDVWSSNVIDEVSSEYHSESEPQESMPQSIFVHVCGAVVTPGVYELSCGSRVYEAISRAGGMLPEADNTYINLADSLQDGAQIRVLTKDEVMKQDLTDNSISQSNPPNNGKININTASAKELTQLSGVGDSRAQAIIAYRESHGNFSSIEQIKKVDGIKDGLFQKIKDNIIVH